LTHFIHTVYLPPLTNRHTCLLYIHNVFDFVVIPVDSLSVQHTCRIVYICTSRYHLLNQRDIILICHMYLLWIY